MLLVLKAAEAVLDLSPLSKLYLAVSRACYLEAKSGFLRSEVMGSYCKRMLGAYQC